MAKRAECGKPVVKGVNAVARPRRLLFITWYVDVCDNCAGISRTLGGYALGPDGLTLMDMDTGEVEYILPKDGDV